MLHKRLPQLAPGEIVYARITTSTIPAKRKPAKILTSKTIVFAVSWSGYSPELSWDKREDRMIINKFGVQEDLVITGLDVISRHGFIGKHLKSQS